MTIGRIMDLIALVQKVNECDDIIAHIKIDAHAEVYVYDCRTIGKRTFEDRTSIYYTTENRQLHKVERHPNNDNIITMKDPDLKRAEFYLKAIITWMERGTE